MSIELETKTREKRPDPSASELIIRLHDRYPDETRAQLRDRFIDRGRDYDNVTDETLGSFFDLKANTLIGTTRKPTSSEERERTAKASAAYTETAKGVMVSNLLGLMQANGKALRDCTFGEVAKFGGGLSRLAKMGKPNQIVGKLVSETQVRALLAAK